MSYEISQRVEDVSSVNPHFHRGQISPVGELTGKRGCRVLAREHRQNGTGSWMQQGVSEGTGKETALALRHYQELYELAPIGYLVLDAKGVVRDINLTAAMLFGAERRAFLGKPFLLWVANESIEIYQQLLRRVSDTGTRVASKSILFKMNRSNFHVSFECRLLSDINSDSDSVNYLISFSDITEQIYAEAKLQEMKLALKVLLKQREEDKADMKRNILANIRKLVISHLERFNQTRSGEDQARCLQGILTHIEDMVSPLQKTVAGHYAYLTPREIEIVNLMKDHHRTKEIACLLGLSSKAVEFHKANIRRKMGLTNSKISLRTHLASLESA